MTKTSIAITLDEDLRLRFNSAAKSSHRTPEDVIVELMQDYADQLSEDDGYDEFLRRKVEIGRASMYAGQGRSNEEVEAFFSALRGELAQKSQ